MNGSTAEGIRAMLSLVEAHGEKYERLGVLQRTGFHDPEEVRRAALHQWQRDQVREAKRRMRHG